MEEDSFGLLLGPLACLPTQLGNRSQFWSIPKMDFTHGTSAILISRVSLGHTASLVRFKKRNPKKIRHNEKLTCKWEKRRAKDPRVAIFGFAIGNFKDLFLAPSGHELVHLNNDICSHKRQDTFQTWSYAPFRLIWVMTKRRR